MNSYPCFDQSDILGRESELMQTRTAASSVAVLAEILLRSPRKLFIFIIKKYISRVKVSKKIIS